MKRIIIICTLLSIFISCSKVQEFGFNEKVANEFLQEMNSADDLHAKYFEDSTIISRSPSAENSVEVKEASKLSENSIAGLKNISGITVSPDAMPFYKATLEYLEETKNFGVHCNDFFKENNPEIRKDYFNLVQKKYESLNRKPDSILALQKIYLQKEGIK